MTISIPSRGRILAHLRHERAEGGEGGDSRSEAGAAPEVDPAEKRN